MDTNQLLTESLKNLGADRLPSPVLIGMQAEITAWETELQQEAEDKLRARVKKKVTKPWIGKLCLAHFNEGVRRKARLKADTAGVGNVDREGV